MLVRRERLSSENLDLKQSSVLNLSESCHLRRKSCSATVAILSAWRWRIHLEPSHHAPISLDSLASYRNPAPVRLRFQSHFRQTGSGSCELSGRETVSSLECTVAT